MFSASTLPLALLATLSTVTASSFNSPHGGHAIRRAPSHHWSRSNLPGRVNSSRPRMARRGSSDEPSTLSEGSLTAAEGCTQWYHVAAGDSCYSAIATVTGGLALEDFYSMNPQINEDCFNLWAGFDYCVARTTTSSSSSATSSKAVANNAVVHAVQTTSSQTTTTAAASSTASAEDDDEDCDADDEEYASTSAPVRAAVAQTTTAAPATSTDGRLGLVLQVFGRRRVGFLVQGCR
ncbi:hypothetical protein BCR35DRAFT_62559 [Leucosporidium creatinivorum]|uniref:LysM domain-containing protein n=1 Tax=Leucosporidium creatinivorum TaxID=106004 RepID=A0A1Y2FJN3_9BASI|nr:hypothetical protein BCR35DRAFT_62559 [Leucosporidium creatinivorum]